MVEQKTLISKGIELERPWPRNLRQGDQFLFSKEKQKKIADAYVRFVPELWLSREGLVMHGFKFNEHAFPGPSAVMTHGLKIKTRHLLRRAYTSFAKAPIYKGPCFCLTDAWSDSYYHWFFDVIPKLWCLRSKWDIGTLLLPEILKSRAYVRDSLRLLGVPHIEYVDRDVFCRQAYIADPLAPSGNVVPSVMQEIRNNLRTQSKQNLPIQQPSYERVYITRSKAGRRRLKNEADLLECFKRWKVKVIAAEDLSLLEMAEVLRNCKLLISNHGAGLSNLLFLPDGAGILEMRHQKDSHNNAFFALTSALDLAYYYVLCSPLNNQEDPHTADLNVNVNELEGALKEIKVD